jgi:hypothetical protein
MVGTVQKELGESRGLWGRENGISQHRFKKLINSKEYGQRSDYGFHNAWTFM